jgi:hypothetical protein
MSLVSEGKKREEKTLVRRGTCQSIQKGEAGHVLQRRTDRRGTCSFDPATWQWPRYQTSARTANDPPTPQPRLPQMRLGIRLSLPPGPASGISPLVHPETCSIEEWDVAGSGQVGYSINCIPRREAQRLEGDWRAMGPA